MTWHDILAVLLALLLGYRVGHRVGWNAALEYRRKLEFLFARSKGGAL